MLQRCLFVVVLLGVACAERPSLDPRALEGGPVPAPGAEPVPGEAPSVEAVATLVGEASHAGTSVRFVEVGRAVLTAPDGSFRLPAPPQSVYTLELSNGPFSEQVPGVMVFSDEGLYLGGARIGTIELPRGRRLATLQRPAARRVSSAGGAFVALVSPPGSGGVLSLVELATGATTVVDAGLEEDDRIAFSPDAAYLAYAKGRALHVSATGGGAAPHLVDAELSTDVPFSFATEPVRLVYQRDHLDYDYIVRQLAAAAPPAWVAEPLLDLPGPESFLLPGGGLVTSAGFGDRLVRIDPGGSVVVLADEGVERLVVSEDGSRAAYVTPGALGPLLRVVALPSGAPVHTEVGAVDDVLRLSGDGRRLLFSRRIGQAESLFAVALAPEAGEPRVRLLTASLGGEVAFVPGAGDRVVFVEGRADSLFALGVVKVASADSGIAATLTREEAFYGGRPFEFSRDGSRVLFEGATPAGSHRLHVAGTLGTPAVEVAGGASRFAAARLSPDGARVLFAEGNPLGPRAHTRILAVPASGGEPVVLARGARPQLALSPDGTQATLLADCDVQDRCGVSVVPTLGGPARLLQRGATEAWWQDERLLSTVSGSVAPWSFRDGVYALDPR